MGQLKSCDEFWDLLSAYADSAITSADAAKVERHTAICPECARDLRFMRETALVLAATPEVVPPPMLRESILAATIYKPTWQQRLRETGRKLVPSLPLRAVAFAGSAAAILLVGYIAVTSLTAPGVKPGSTEIPLVKITPNPGNSAGAVKPPLIADDDSSAKRSVGNPAGGNGMDDISDSSLDPVGPAPPLNRSVANVRRSHPGYTGYSSAAASLAQADTERSDRERAVRALESRPDMNGGTRRSGPRIVVAASRRPAFSPDLQPERIAQPKDMLSQPMIDTADMKMPMTAMSDTMGTNPMHDMGHADAGSAGAAAPVPAARPRIALAVNTTDSSVPSSILTLADLRRQLRRQSNDSSALHPEFRLRNSRETLDVVKSTF